ncbi:MAG: hypothetical protein ACREMQ_21965 [Longimicrobiales bacterium]
MARTRIHKTDGTPTPFFWSDKDTNDPTRKRVYKQTTDGVKRMKYMRFNVTKNKMVRD